MKNQGTIYVVMPAYNAEKFIGTAFDSLLAQTYSDWKCLCVNDGSNDKTLEIMQKYAQKDKRFIIFTQENKGVTYSRNFLLNRVQGPYLAFLDADDYWHPQMLETLLSKLVSTRSDIAECSLERFYDFPPKEQTSYIEINQIQENILTNMNIFLSRKTWKGYWINIWNKIYRWDKVKDIRFSEELSYEDDYFYNSLTHSCIQKKVLIPATLYFYRKNPSSLCGNVNWQKYQKAGIARIRLSYEYFILGNRVPKSIKKDFLFDLTQDAYRMIVRKPLKRKDKTLFKSAQQAMTTYLQKGIAKRDFIYCEYWIYR